MNMLRTAFYRVVALALLLVVTSGAAQESVEWEYLVVSYGTTYFSNPLVDLSEMEASRSKVLLFSELGITLPSEATSLQRDIDVLGRFAWELVAVVGTIGGDQQLVFKRPYDEARSAAEAERIRSERDALLEAYEATRTAEAPDTGTPLVDVDAIERAQAVEARNTRDEGRVRYLVEQAAGWGFTIPELVVGSRAWSPDQDPDVRVELVLDVTGAAVIAPGQYRRSLADKAFDAFVDALVRVGFEETDYSFCMGQAEGEAQFVATLSVMHDGALREVGSRRLTMCFAAP